MRAAVWTPVDAGREAGSALGGPGRLRQRAAGGPGFRPQCTSCRPGRPSAPDRAVWSAGRHRRVREQRGTLSEGRPCVVGAFVLGMSSSAPVSAQTADTTDRQPDGPDARVAARPGPGGRGLGEGTPQAWCLHPCGRAGLDGRARGPVRRPCEPLCGGHRGGRTWARAGRAAPQAEAGRQWLRVLARGAGSPKAVCGETPPSLWPVTAGLGATGF